MNTNHKPQTALLLKKVMERLLDTSIQYNFVQHFYTGPRPSEEGKKTFQWLANKRS